MRKQKYACGICRIRKADSKDSLCPHCERVVEDMLLNETRQMVAEIASTTESVIQDLESGVIHYDANTNKLLTDPVEIVTAILEGRLVAQPPMAEMIKEHPHLAYMA